MWQTQDVRKLLLFMQLFQQWLQIAAATLHLEELEEQKKKTKRGEKEKGGKTKNQTTENACQWVRQWLLRRPMYRRYEKLMHELTTEDQTNYPKFPADSSG